MRYIPVNIYRNVFGDRDPDRDPVAEPDTATDSPGNWWTVFANPDVWVPEPGESRDLLTRR
jgi:hypothetical protein